MKTTRKTGFALNYVYKILHNRLAAMKMREEFNQAPPEVAEDTNNNEPNNRIKIISLIMLILISLNFR